MFRSRFPSLTITLVLLGWILDEEAPVSAPTAVVAADCTEEGSSVAPAGSWQPYQSLCYCQPGFVLDPVQRMCTPDAAPASPETFCRVEVLCTPGDETCMRPNG